MIKSIVILTFENIIKNQDVDYLCKSIPLEINHQLSKYKTIRVIANHSIESFNDLQKNMQIDLLLKGSFLKVEHQIRFNIELFDNVTHTCLDSLKLEYSAVNIFELIDHVSTNIIEFFKLKNIPEKRLQKLSSSAYKSYLKGLQYWNSWNENNVVKAIEHFKDAVTQEPHFALSYARIAHCYSLLAAIDLEHGSQHYQLAKSAALKAVNLDDSIIEAHLSLALIKLLNDLDILGAYYSIEKAFSLNNHSSETHYYYAFYLLAVGKYKQAVDAVKYALENDPFNIQKNSTYGFALSLWGKYDLAEKQLEKTLGLSPNSIPTYDALIWNCIMNEQYEKAKVLVHKKGNDIFLTPATQIVIHFNLGLLHETKLWEDKLTDLLYEDSPIKYDREASFSFYELGNKKKGMQHFELFYQQKKGFIRALTHPAWKKIRESDAFYIYKKRLKLINPPLLPKHLTEIRDDIIVINSLTSESISISSKHLLYIESQSSYSKIVYINAHQVLEEKILRTSLSKIMAESMSSNLYRCHNSFIINTKIPYSISGNRKKLQLHLKAYAVTIPVSRIKASEIHQHITG